ncbi:MAG: hypothetical protein ACI8TQ_003485 [Planctomycetota bacterium]
MAAAPLQLKPVVGEAQCHAQDEFGGWYINYREGQMDQPGSAVSCALDISISSGGARDTFEMWNQMAGFETNQRILPKLQMEPLPFTWGHELSSRILLENSQAIGNVVVAREGSRTVWLEWRGGALLTVADLKKYVVPSLNSMMAIER